MRIDAECAGIAAEIVAAAVAEWRRLSGVDEELSAFISDAIARYLTALRELA